MTDESHAKMANAQNFVCLILLLCFSILIIELNTEMDALSAKIDTKLDLHRTINKYPFKGLENSITEAQKAITFEVKASRVFCSRG